jgi:tRNA G18 (ribose-2'-O)-methylase SpoU
MTTARSRTRRCANAVYSWRKVDRRRRAIVDPHYHHSRAGNHAAHRDLGDLLGRLPAGTPIHIRPPDEIAAVTGFKFHRGCLALVHRPPAAPLDSILDAPSPIVLLEDVANPDNVGGVFRNAAAFGAGGIIISPGCCDPLYRKAVRTSMGAVLRVPYARPDDWRSAIERVRRRGFALVALTPRQPSELLGEFVQRARTMKRRWRWVAKARVYQKPLASWQMRTSHRSPATWTR